MALALTNQNVFATPQAAATGNRIQFPQQIFGPNLQTGSVFAPTGSKALDWLGKHANKIATEQNHIIQAMFLAENPAQAIKDFANKLINIKTTAAPATAYYANTVIPTLRTMGLSFTEKEADAFVYKHAKRYVDEIQALMLSRNPSAYRKLKSLGGLKGTVSRKARRIYKKHYARRSR